MSFRLRSPRPVPWVELRGEVERWTDGGAMERGPDGVFERSLRLGAGCWQYKFLLADGTWELDPENPRTRSWRGARNSVAVVGGAEEPVLHAPARPWLHLEDDGRLTLRAGLRRTAGSALSVRWDEGHGPRSSAMSPVADEDEHRLFELRLPVSARHLEYLFVLEGGRLLGAPGGAGQGFRCAPSALKPTTPAWWRDAVVYSIFVDRFRRGGGWRVDPDTHRGSDRAGGDLRGVREALPYLRDLGVTALHLTPLALAPSAHRYDAIAPREVDPDLGGDEALRELLEGAHALGLRVLLDVTVTHVHRDFHGFRDVRARGPASPWWGWFRVHRHPFLEGYEPGYEHYQKGAWQEPLLRTDHEEVVDFLCGTFERWARAGADGFRVDAAADIPLGLLRRISSAVRAVNPDAALFGEVLPEHLHRWTADALDAATEFSAREGLLDLVLRGRPAREVSQGFARRRALRGGAGWSSLAFTGTHDHPRLLTLTGDARKARLAQLLVLTGASVPMLYYGDEVGLRSDEPHREFEDCWPDRACVPWDPSRWDGETLSMVRGALALRAEHRCLRRGDEAWPEVTYLDGDGRDDVLALRRSLGREVLEVLVHAGEGARTVALPAGAPSEATGLLTVGEAHIDHARGGVTLGAWSGLVLRRGHPEEVTLSLGLAASEASERASEAWREGHTEGLFLPTRLYVTVTEACNLRCLHCITDAPRRTREGRARVLQPWVLEALGDAFGAAEYVAFVHGGESLVAPVFWDTLRALRAARGGRACHVHLLTNGMRLDGDTTRRLIDHGVTSVSVSLDGATGETNDAIRLGARFTTLKAHLAEAVAAREATGADLRLGVSAVVGETNLSELVTLGALVRDLGLDWLKVEETFPATPFALRDLVAPRDPRLEARMTALRAALAGSRVTLVDHRDPPRGCPCEAARDPLLAAFRAADDYANRVRFRPCRADWEQCCVDPDGVVHPVDYDQAPLGSLAELPLLALWNSAAMGARRAAALARAPADRRTCRG